MFSSIMAKKNYKQRCKSEKDHMGCMSGLIHLLDFRRGPKLISDGRVKSDPKVSETIDGNISADNDKDSRVGSIFAGRASIKTLMEEEMASSTQPLKQGQRSVAGISYEDFDLNLAASLMEIYRNHNEGWEISNSVESGHSYNLIDKDNNTDPAEYPNQLPSSIQKALEDVAEAVIKHQSANTKYIIRSGEARSKEFLDALQLLSSDKELFLMLMQDRSSRLLECLQNLYTLLGSTKLECEGYDEETELEGVRNGLEQSVNSPSKMQKKPNSFLKEDKLVTRKPPKLNDNSRGLSRIVILKPNPGRNQSSLISRSVTSSPLSNHTDLLGREGDGSGHHFSLRELKRRLRLAVSDSQKDQQLNAMSSTFHKAEADSTKQFLVTSMSASLASTDSSDCNEVEEPSTVDKNTVPEENVSGMRNDVTHGVGSFSYEKAKMYLLERLNNQGEDCSKIVHKSDSFERLISLPVNEAFSTSHCSQEDNVILPHEPTNPSKLHTVEQEDGSVSTNPAGMYQETVSSGISNADNETLAELKMDHGNHSLIEGTISQESRNEGAKNLQDTVENLPLCAEIEISHESVGESNLDQCSVEQLQSMSVLQEVAVHPPGGPINEQENHSSSGVVGLVKPSVLTFIDSPENTNDREEKLSPQSVLDPVIGDATSRRHKTQKQDELSMPTSRALLKELDSHSASPVLWNGPQVAILDDKDARCSFIKAVLGASELLPECNSQIWYTEEPLLDISVLAEVGNLYCLTDDVVLLFDCVEEVLLKIRDGFFGVEPWVAFLKRNVRPASVGKDLAQEVAKCIDSLVVNGFANTLDQVVMRDLETESWMDLRPHAANVVIEVWDGLLDDLLEEMVFDLWL
ncbi:hypothetical protein ACP4OV_004158 [Aristida adscensionis]